MTSPGPAQGPGMRPLHVYSLGFARAAPVRRILALAGWRVTTGWPGPGGTVGVWGAKPVARRGLRVARTAGARVITIEDGFLRSVLPGVTGEPPLSIVLDDVGIYHDASRPSRLERLIADGTDVPRGRAEAGIALLRRERLSKYTPPVPTRDFGAGHVLVVDQTAGDASIAGAGAGPDSFLRMLDAARAEWPGAPIVVKAHPDVSAGAKRGHFRQADLRPGETLLTEPVNPWDLIEGAAAIYTVSSQMGYEAVLAGRPVRCFGMPFYGGWGLTEDEARCPRRTRRPDPLALFAACHLAYPLYYDPWRDRLTDYETVVQALSAMVHAATPEPGSHGEVFAGVRLWKRRNVAAFRPRRGPRPRFADDLNEAARIARAEGRHAWLWASKAPADALKRLAGQGVRAGFVEDGFLRSVGLGAELTEAASLVFDRCGIYFDPARPSGLEALVGAAAAGAAELPRAAALRRAIVDARVTKYNVGVEPPAPPRRGRVVLVPGQVEDDASILRGCGDVRTNLGLLQAARATNPDAWIVYKPHPDVEAGLRAGAVPAGQVRELADEIAERASAAALIGQADEVWTLTSLLGFEALLRGKRVTCLGAPFYAGWGLTEDRGPVPARRTARPGLDGLVWAALIAYPRYVDPVSGLPCTPEVVVDRLAAGVPMRRARVLSRLQGLLASRSWLWR